MPGPKPRSVRQKRLNQNYLKTRTGLTRAMGGVGKIPMNDAAARFNRAETKLAHHLGVPRAAMVVPSSGWPASPREARTSAKKNRKQLRSMIRDSEWGVVDPTELVGSMKASGLNTRQRARLTNRTVNRDSKGMRRHDRNKKAADRKKERETERVIRFRKP